MTTAVVGAAGLVLASLVGGLLLYLQNTRIARIERQGADNVAAQNAAIAQTQTDLERQRVHAEAVEQLRTLYEHMLGQVQREVDRLSRLVERLNAEVDRLQEKLTRELDTSVTLHTQIRELRTAFADLEETLRQTRVEKQRIEQRLAALLAEQGAAA